MKVILPQLLHVLPGTAAELGLPVGGEKPLFSFPENIVVLVLLLSLKRPGKPLVLGRGMVEHHVKHQSHAPVSRLFNEAVQVFHGAEQRVNVVIVRNIVSIVILRRDEEGRKPQIIDSQFL